MSSLGEISVTIKAVNEATPVFETVSSDAARMGENIRAASSSASASMSTVGASAAEMGSQIRAAAPSFDELSAKAHTCEVSLLTVGRAISTVGRMGTGIITLAHDFGLVDRETAKWMRTVTTVITVIGTFARVQSYLTMLTTGHTAAVTINTTAQTANASSSLLVAAAHKVKAAATWIAVTAQNALNVSFATWLALTGVGIGVIIAAAAAVAMFASQTREATESVREYNAAVSEMATRTVRVRTVVRAGEEEMYRRGVEP